MDRVEAIIEAEILSKEAQANYIDSCGYDDMSGHYREAADALKVALEAYRREKSDLHRD